MSVPSGLSRHESLQLLGLTTEEILVLTTTTRCTPELKKAVELEEEEEIQASKQSSKQACKQECQVNINGVGLSQQTKGSTRAMRPKDQPDPLDQRNNQIIDECENIKWDGGFYRERRGSRGREWTNERKAPSCFGRGRGGGTPLPPP